MRQKIEIILPWNREMWFPRQFVLRVMLLVLCLVTLFTGSTVYGQTDQGAITGTVNDPGVAVVPNAQLVLTNTDTGLVLKTTTDASGVYTFSPVKIGNYTLTATANGFATTTQQGLQLHLQQRLEVNVQLQVGAVTQQVEVTAVPPLLQTEEASVGEVVTTQAINDTPLNGRNWVFIAQLAAGSVSANGSASGDFDSNGMRQDMNNFILDGVDNNNTTADFKNGATYVVRPPPDALSEFKVQTSNYSAEFGHSAGAVVNASIKSGTNQIHGDLWEYVRNTALTARDWEAPAVPPYHENQFGATLGLPIIKNKLFFFGDLENNRIAQSGFTNIVVPTALMRTGQFSELNAGGINQLTGGPAVPLFQPNTANPIPNNDLRTIGMGTIPGKLSAVALHLLTLYPCPGLTTATAATLIQQTGGDCGVSRPSTDNTFQWDNRVDYNFSSTDQAFIRFSYSNQRTFRSPPLGMTLDGGDSGKGQYLSENTSISETHIFAPSLTNEFRLGYDFGRYARIQVNANKPNLAASLGLGGIPNNFTDAGGLPAIYGGGQSPYGDISISPDLGSILWGSPPFQATIEHLDNFQLLDNVTKIAGNHALKFGVSIRYIRFITLQPPLPRGFYNYSGAFTGNEAGGTFGSGFADYLLNEISSASITQVSGSDQLRWDSSLFVQDDWKVNKKLTLNLGLRWEDPTSYKDLHGRQANFAVTGPLGIGTGTANYLLPISLGTSPSVGDVFIPNFAAPDHVSVVYTPNQYLVSNQWKNFAPRLGLAYRLSNRAVARVGYGIFFAGLESVGYGPNMGQNFPFLPTANFVSPSCVGPGNCLPATTNLGHPFTLETGFADVINTPGGFINAISTPPINMQNVHTKVPYTEDFNLTVQYSLTKDMAFSVAYVGSQSHKLILPLNTNQARALLPANANIGPVRPFPHFGDFTSTEYLGSDSYNSLQIGLERQYSNGLSFSTNYTWAHSIAVGAGEVGGGGSNNIDSPLVPLKLTASATNFDARNRFTFNGNYELPFGHGKRFANSSKVLDLLVGGWSDSLTFIAQSGLPIVIFATNTDSWSPAAGTNTASGPPQAVKVRDPFAGGGTPPPGAAATVCPAVVHNRQNWYNPCAFINPTGNGICIGTTLATETPTCPTPIPTMVTGAAALPYFGDLKGEQINGPGFYRINMSLFKGFKFETNKEFQFRADVFNLFNHPSWGAPGNTGIGNDGGSIQGPQQFGGNTPDARFWQLSLKFLF